MDVLARQTTTTRTDDERRTITPAEANARECVPEEFLGYFFLLFFPAWVYDIFPPRSPFVFNNAFMSLPYRTSSRTERNVCT